ncbi:carbamoyl-phosphate synthase large subunit [Sedimentibacter hydroxybenzoicus DSM 7310]|uniref:Carbamoyl phosphate synthase large chain n=1 Tax=Sedimentibacter hydroxybenzoicus DSM 7310 TaxID=1123245 RepID=A0A974GXH7_SEDHY|nr:carbamoyl-phosphate synthase large subunit [Sedimentibacter hydroxybenzoicus]NYB75607.1 carbamoyl-phosphate synthase large subunit [Sedimentibacter hydroxybenzoicus DSM 7310]
MTLDTSIKKVLVIGSGPIVIGQAAEFDYSGTQACRALREEGIETILINSNPATIMTDKDIADKVYIEPLTVEFAEKIIAKERPDSVIAGMGGQTGLNLTVELYDKGILDKYNVKVIGTSVDSIKKGEDRELFKKTMNEIGEPIVDSEIVTDLDEGKEAAVRIGYPVIIRPAYTLGGSGGGIAGNENELTEILTKGLQLSMNKQVLIEKSIKGWKEIEYEVMRDKNGTCIAICNMENFDPVGVHTGDSIVVAPSQTLSDVEYQMLRTASIKIIDAIGIEGGCNVQLALNPDNFEYVVIEINPRVSRSSALASKATGYPIAKVAAKIALGYTLDEIKNSVTEKTYAAFEPSLDYVVLKIPKWPFDKFFYADRILGTKMMATGEVMAIGNNFEAALLKAVRSLEIKQYNLYSNKAAGKSISELKAIIQNPDDERLFYIAELIRRGYRIDRIAELTKIDEFFLHKISNIVNEEEKLRKIKIELLDDKWLKKLKKIGFSDRGIADLIGSGPNDIYNLRMKFNIKAVYKMVDTCSGEFEAISPYYYSTYDEYDEVQTSDKKKILVIGSGPIRIGQGVEFDYCSVHCIFALQKCGVETIIINNNPETVSTDFDIADKLYFEPLTEEDVLNIVEKEHPDGVILQFGGQTAIKLANFFKEKNIPILGTNPEQIDAAEDREKFDAILESLNIKRPIGKAVLNLNDGIKAADQVGYPVLVRPSYVLGGQGMEVTYTREELVTYLENAFKSSKNPVLIDKYLVGREIEVDAICDGEDILIPGIMEHLERAGIHSGDSIAIYPPKNLSSYTKLKLEEITKKIAKSLKSIGMINIQFVEYKDELYVIEVNPRSSRTVPYISKVTKVPMIELATRVMLGEKLKDMRYGTGLYKESSLTAVKVPVFSTQKLTGVEVSLGPEMKSTGEVLGIGRTYFEALYKGFIAAGLKIPDKSKKILATIRDADKENFKELAFKLNMLGYKIVATKNTAKHLNNAGIKAEVVNKVTEKTPNIIDFIKNGEIGLVIDIPTKANNSGTDGFKIRRTSVEASINVLTSLDTVAALVEVMESGISDGDGEADIYNISLGSHSGR